MIIIIDGNHLACRCYFSLNKPGNNSALTTKEGKRTELIYSFLSSFKKLVKNHKEEDTVFFLTWDGGNAKRREIFPQYKAGRKPFECSFYEQLDEIRNIINFLGLKQYHIRNVEADDLIGTLTIKSRKKGKKVLIISSDHDFEQLISNNVTVLHPLANDLIKDVNWVKQNYGIEPNKIVEMMALTGDPTDNIPGIDKVGEKTAVKLIIANNGLDSLLANVDNLKTLNKNNEIVNAKDDLKLKIKNSIETIKLAKQLSKINCEIEIEPDFSKPNKNIELLQQKFKELEFEQFLSNFEEWKLLF
jgi:DNA polymerase-1